MADNPKLTIDPYSVTFDRNVFFSNYCIQYVSFRTMDGKKHMVKGFSWNSNPNYVRVKINNEYHILIRGDLYVPPIT